MITTPANRRYVITPAFQTYRSYVDYEAEPRLMHVPVMDANVLRGRTFTEEHLVFLDNWEAHPQAGRIAEQLAIILGLSRRPLPEPLSAFFAKPQPEEVDLEALPKFYAAQNRWAYANWCSQNGLKQDHAVYITAGTTLDGRELKHPGQVIYLDGWEKNYRAGAIRDAIRAALHRGKK